ncbi:DUF3576 domain-containing protein [Glacieibacterium sp.]|uniref:DUF3576 domain-containing protein n=1 Tax=Glacieibacterium sp. TaxID=2860237 RepID=UPI003B00A98D
MTFERNTMLVVLATGLALAGCGHKVKPKSAGTLAPARISTIGVNSYLWQASLETMSFMPLATVDSNGGVIVTDWYINPAIPGERVKVSIFILDTELRADAIRVSASRQINTGGSWVEATVRAGTVQKLEETILGRARDLRRAQIGA